MQLLRANTQVKVVIGPVVAVGDGFTPVTTLSVSTADEAEIMKHDAASVTDISGATFTAITSADGYYNLTLTTSHTDTEGLLTVLINDDSLCLPVKQTFMVLAEAAYDSMFVAKDDGFMDVNIKTVGRADTQETEATNLEAACAAYSATRGLAGTALPAAAADAAGGLPISDAGGLDLDAQRSDVAAILVDTGTTLQGELDGIQADTEDIQSRLPAALVGGRIDATVDGTGMEAGAVTAIQSGLATAAALATAQADLDILTGTDGAVIASGTQTFNMTGSITGNLSGSVGSVTGAVGSVTGNVGGNVAGSVASVTGGINTAAGTIQTLDALDTAQDTQHGTTQTYLTNNLGSAGAAATEAGGTGDHLTALATQASVDTIGGIVDAILMDTNELQTNQGNWLTATGFSTHSAADVWAVATRTLTAGTNIVLAKGTGVTGFNDISVANILTGFNTSAKPADGDPATWTWLEAQWMLNRRFFAKTVHDADAGTITVHDFDAGKTAITKQSATAVGNVETQDEAATP